MRFDLSSRSTRTCRAALAALLGFALAFQAIVASIHLHPLHETGAGRLVAGDGMPGVPKVHDELNCPLCLVIKGGSSYVPPAIVVAPPEAGSQPGPAARDARLAVPAPRASAQPRAPPVLA